MTGGTETQSWIRQWYTFSIFLFVAFFPRSLLSCSLMACSSLPKHIILSTAAWLPPHSWRLTWVESTSAKRKEGKLHCCVITPVIHESLWSLRTKRNNQGWTKYWGLVEPADLSSSAIRNSTAINRKQGKKKIKKIPGPNGYLAPGNSPALA